MALHGRFIVTVDIARPSSVHLARTSPVAVVIASCDAIRPLAPPLYSNRLVNMTPPYDSHSHTVRINNTKRRGTLDVRDRPEIGLARARGHKSRECPQCARVSAIDRGDKISRARRCASRSWRVTRARAKARCRPRRARGDAANVDARASSRIVRGRARTNGETTPTNRSINHTSKSHRIGG